MRAPWLSALLLVAAAGCGGADAAAPMDPGPEKRVAWVGEASVAGGTLQVMVEPIQRAGVGHAVFVQEEELDRQLLRVPEGEVLLRVHLLGPGAALQDAGEVLLQDGSRMHSFGPPPTDLTLRGRSRWVAVARGDPPPDPELARARRSFLVRGRSRPGIAPRRWEGGIASAELEAREWGEAERLAWLESPFREESETPATEEEAKDG